MLPFIHNNQSSKHFIRGGQDTKIISLVNGKVADFVMNDKCPAGTGKFLELMANTLGVGIVELARMPLEGENISMGNS